MLLTPTVTFRGMAMSQALEADIRSRIRKLETYYGSIVGCRVLVEFSDRRHESGNHFHVRVDLTVPGEEIVVNHEASLHGGARDLEESRATKRAEPDPEKKYAYVAVKEAFDTARRRLQDFARRQRGDVKSRIRMPHGRVTQLFPLDEYGYIEAEDGHEVYFQKNSVVNGAFDRLMPGCDVAFVEQPGAKGPQASTVRLLHPHRSRQPAAPPFA